MKTELIQSLTENFEAHAQQTEGGVEFWLARDLQYLLGYTEWRNFTTVITKAKASCEVSGHDLGDHFVDVNKTIAMPKGAEKEVPDIMLTRYACYLIAQNGDPKKQEIAFAQTYFAVQTRGGADRTTVTGSGACHGPQETDRNGKGAVRCHLRTDRRQPKFRVDPQQG